MDLAFQIVAVVSTVLAIIGWTLRHGLKEQAITQGKSMKEMWLGIRSNAGGLGELRIAHTHCQATTASKLEETGRDIKEIKAGLQRIENKIFNGG